MTHSLTRLIAMIALVILGAWLVMLLFRIAAWLINGLVGVAAVVIVGMLIYRFVTKKSTPSKKPPLKIEREPSKE